MIEVDLYEHLKTNVPSVDGRVFANVIHQDTTKPTLVYTVLEEHPVGGRFGRCPDADHYREWVIHLYHAEYTANKQNKNEVTAALESFAIPVKSIAVADGFDEEQELFVQIITFHTGKKERS